MTYSSQEIHENHSESFQHCSVDVPSKERLISQPLTMSDLLENEQTDDLNHYIEYLRRTEYIFSKYSFVMQTNTKAVLK